MCVIGSLNRIFADKFCSLREKEDRILYFGGYKYINLVFPIKETELLGFMITPQVNWVVIKAPNQPSEHASLVLQSLVIV